jgi:hypothetical protein
MEDNFERTDDETEGRGLEERPSGLKLPWTPMGPQVTTVAEQAADDKDVV